MSKQKKKQNTTPLSPAVQSIVDAYRQSETETDPLGSYTGVPIEDVGDIGDAARSKPESRADQATFGGKQYVKPIQDVDDL